MCVNILPYGQKIHMHVNFLPRRGEAPLGSAACVQNSSEGACSLRGAWFATRTNLVTSLGFSVCLAFPEGRSCSSCWGPTLYPDLSRHESTVTTTRTGVGCRFMLRPGQRLGRPCEPCSRPESPGQHIAGAEPCRSKRTNPLAAA